MHVHFRVGDIERYREESLEKLAMHLLDHWQVIQNAESINALISCQSTFSSMKTVFLFKKTILRQYTILIFSKLYHFPFNLTWPSHFSDALSDDMSLLEAPFGFSLSPRLSSS